MAKKSKKVVYVRFGRWRPDEISFNYASGSIEAGVSVFEAVPEGGRLRVLLDREHDPDDRQADTLSGWVARIRDERRRDAEQTPIFIVDGDLVGVGYDGEPLLKRLKIIQEIEPENLFAPEIGLR